MTNKDKLFKNERLLAEILVQNDGTSWEDNGYITPDGTRFYPCDWDEAVDYTIEWLHKKARGNLYDRKLYFN